MSYKKYVHGICRNGNGEEDPVGSKRRVSRLLQHPFGNSETVNFFFTKKYMYMYVHVQLNS